MNKRGQRRICFIVVFLVSGCLLKSTGQPGPGRLFLVNNEAFHLNTQQPDLRQIFVTTDKKNSPGQLVQNLPTGRSINILAIYNLPGDYYTLHFGFFCRKELDLKKQLPSLCIFAWAPLIM